MSSNFNFGFSAWGTNDSPEFKSRWISNEEIIQILNERKIEKPPLIKYIKRLSNDDLLTILNSITEILVTNRTMYGSLTHTLYSMSNSELFVLAEYLRRYRIRKERSKKKERIESLKIKESENYLIQGASYNYFKADDLVRTKNPNFTVKDIKDAMDFFTQQMGKQKRKP